MLRIGILGAAGIAPRSLIAPAKRRSDVQVVAIASARHGAGRAYAAAHGISRAYDSYQALIRDPEVDAVYNALPPAAHADWSIAALQAGKHVLCEKPMAMSVAQVRSMVSAAERGRRVLMEAFHDRFHPLALHILALRGSGQLGSLRFARAEFQVHIPFDPTSIRHDPRQGGGAMMDLGCYPVRWLRDLFGAEPTVIAASGERNPLGADLRMSAQLQFPGDATAELVADMATGPMKSLLHIEAERGTVTVSNPVLPHLGHSVDTTLDGRTSQYTVGGETTYDYQLQAFIDALRAPQPSSGMTVDSIANMEVIEKIYAAAGFNSETV